MNALAGIVVVLCGLWLVGLAVFVVAAPARATAFLTAFASSARAHYTEQLLRLVGGAAFLVYAPQMRYAEAFRLFGWVVVVTAAILLLMPWRWHRRIGGWVIPMATRNLKLFAFGALALGVFVLFSVL